VTAPGNAPWPPTYQGRLRALDDQQWALRALLGPLHDAARAFHALGVLGPGEGIEVTARWPLPAGAVLAIRAGYTLHTDVGEIGRGVIPAPDPMVCLASALHTPELWDEAMAAYREAAAWAAKQAEDYGVPGLE
jgi:hypothetical protein